MASKDSDDYTDALLEETGENFRTVIEAAGDIQRLVRTLPEVRQNTRGLVDDVEVLKVVVRVLSNEIGGLSIQVEHHEHRINRLEAT